MGMAPQGTAHYDPTMDLLQRIHDPAEWVRIPNMPICIPHERVVKHEDGTEHVITVTEEDLPAILNQLVERELNYGSLPIMTIGHRQQSDPHFKETDQPPFVGVTADHALGTFGPRNCPAILATGYFKKKTWDKGFGYNASEGAKDFPFRSMDFYPGTKKVTGIAIMKRDPYLPMGLVTYSAGSPAPRPTLSNRITGASMPYSPVPIIYEDPPDEGAEPKDAPSAPAGAGGGEVGAAPPPGEGADAGPPGHEEWLQNFQWAMQNHPELFGGAGEGAPPGNDEADPMAGAGAAAGPAGGAQPMPQPGEQNSAGMGSRVGRAAQALNPIGRQVGAVNQLRKGHVGAAIGDATGVRPAAKALGFQESAVPTSYQVVIDHMQRRLGAVEHLVQQKDATIRELANKSAVEAGKMLTYQLVNAGVLALYKDGSPDLKEMEKYTMYFARLPEGERQASFENIKANYQKDETLVAYAAYAAHNAPVGGFVQTPTVTTRGTGELSPDEFEAAVEYQRQHPADDFGETVKKVTKRG